MTVDFAEITLRNAVMVKLYQAVMDGDIAGPINMEATIDSIAGGVEEALRAVGWSRAMGRLPSPEREVSAQDRPDAV